MGSIGLPCGGTDEEVGVLSPYLLQRQKVCYADTYTKNTTFLLKILKTNDLTNISPER